MVDSILSSETNNRPFSLDLSQDIILGAIDVGTNSIHLVIVEIEPQLPAFTIIAREKDTVRLGDRDPHTGNLTPEAIERAVNTLQRCKDLATSFNAHSLIATATSAVREAPNGREFIKQVEKTIGIQINLISGQEEARRIYLGVLSGLEFDHHPHVIIDIGGGSTELVLADRYEARFLSSTKVGAVRLTQEYITTDPVSSEELNYLRAYVRGMLERPIDEIRKSLDWGEKPRLVGTSGTIETLVVLLAKRDEDNFPNPLNGYTVKRKHLEELTKDLAKMDFQERCDVPGMSEKRAEIIIAGAIILTEAMKMLNIEELTICERALREGMIVDWMLAHGLIVDRLQFQGEVRQRSVYKIAQKYQVKLDYSEQVAQFAVSLFDQLQGKLHFWGEEERDLLWAAGMLHNSGLYISHSAHHKHSYYLIRHAELLGYTETDIEVIANLARYHRKSKPKKKHDNYQNLPSKHYRRMVDELSAILRIAVALDRRQIGAIASVECQYDSHHKRVHLHLLPKDAHDDCALEIWNLGYKKEIFEDEFGVVIEATVEN
ncbi:MAG: Ppx/GppA family phosphatase [Kamptonema sp. SIO4C4]|nr:Ppx/GppA family phosphatase [Kamptonema sp. SIO4C4]